MNPRTRKKYKSQEIVVTNAYFLNNLRNLYEPDLPRSAKFKLIMSFQFNRQCRLFILSTKRKIENFPEKIKNDCEVWCVDTLHCFTCACGKEHLKYVTLVQLIHNKKYYVIGSCCIEKFFPNVICFKCEKEDVKPSAIKKGDNFCTSCKIKLTWAQKFIDQHRNTAFENITFEINYQYYPDSYEEIKNKKKISSVEKKYLKFHNILEDEYDYIWL